MQLATLLIGLMSATALWSGVQAINGQARSSYDRAANAFGRNAMLVPTHDVTVPQSLFAELRRAGWLVSPVIEGSVRIGGRAINLVGVEPLSLPRSGIICAGRRAVAAGLSVARRPDADRARDCGRASAARRCDGRD